MSSSYLDGIADTAKEDLAEILFHSDSTSIK